MEIIEKKTNKKVKLTKNNFISSGGEGHIYIKDKIAYKIYNNIKNVIPLSKIKELSVISNYNVIKPEGIILNTSGKSIGYSMRYVNNTYLLCQLLAKSFRDRNNISNEMVLKLVQKMQSTIEDIHSKNILIVDLNEMNFLVDKNFKEIYFIDVDSYQTSNFPATAIMDSVRDRHSSSFSKMTDWFSFGIISFHMFCLIHPYKGIHPFLKGFDERMNANIPVFHKDVKFPKVCLPFDIIPQAYKDWFKAIFFDGKRLSPPTDPVEPIVIPIVVKTVMGNEDFDIKEIFEYDSNIIKYISINGVRATITSKDLYISQKKITQINNKNIHIAITPLTDKIISASLVNSNILLYNASDGTTPVYDILADDIMSYQGRVYIKNSDTISEITFVEMGNNIHAVPKHVGNVMENATKLYDGVIIQNVLGSFMISIFPESGLHYQIQCPEFKGYQIIDAKYKDNVLMIIGSKKGKYDKFILKFDNKFSSYSLRKVEDISYCGINFTVLENGVVVHINENEEIEVFSNKKESKTVKVISNSVISGDMKLFNDGVQVVFAKNKKLYRLKMK